MAACRAVYSIVSADVVTDAGAVVTYQGVAPAAAASLAGYQDEVDDGTLHLRLLPHLLALSNAALSLRLNSELKCALPSQPWWRLIPVGSVSLSSQSLAICMMQQDHQMSHAE